MDPRRVTWRDPHEDPPPREHSNLSVGAYKVEHNVRKDLDCLYTQRNAQEEVDLLAGRGGGASPEVQQRRASSLGWSQIVPQHALACLMWLSTPCAD